MSDAGRPVFEVIELIEADPSAFGGAPLEGGATPADLPTPTRRSAVPGVTMGVVALLLAAVLVAVALPPLHASPRAARVLSFPPLRRQLSTLDGHLVFAQAPGTVSSAGLGTVGTDGRAGPSPLRNLTGYVFAAPTAHFTLTGEDSGRWAAFWAAPSGSIDEPGPIGTPDVQVQGTPASVDTYGDETEIVFGPVDGRTFSVRTHDLGREASLRFAEALAIRDGVPTITDDRALADMRPVGSIGEYGAALDVVLTPGETAIPSTNLVFVQYAATEGRYTLASVPAPQESMLPMLRFLMPQGHERTVRGTTGWVVGDAVVPDLLASGTGTLVAWVEGGRLITVIGPDDELATLALAETIRPATDDEWAEITTAAARTPNPLDSSIDASVVLDTGTTPTGTEYSLIATWNDFGRLELCADTSIGNGCNYVLEVSLPVLATLPWDDGTFLMAMVDDATTAEQAFLVVTFPDPAVAPMIYPLVGFGDGLPGPAVGVLLPVGMATAELRVDGVVVATLTISPPTSPLDESVNPPGRLIATAVDPTTQVESKIAVTTRPDGAVLVCFSGPSDGGQQSACEAIETPELPLFQVYNRFGQRWALAMVAIGDADTADLRVTYPDGHTESTQLSDYDGELTGAVAAIDFRADRVAVELLIDGVVVAHL